MCELNVIEQAANVCLTTIVQDAWARGQSLAVHGWIYGLRDGLLRIGGGSDSDRITVDLVDGGDSIRVLEDGRTRLFEAADVDYLVIRGRGGNDRITIDPAILVGKPVVKGTRISVEFVIDLTTRRTGHTA